MPIIITIALAKLASLLSRWLGRGDGSALPGLVAERLDPNILEKLGRRMSGDIVLVTGTNGKTTTTKMLREILGQGGEHVLTNQAGSNLYRGIVASILAQCTLTGELQPGLALFEVDEAAMPEVARVLQPQTIVVLNLFRDQLDRYGELDKTASLIRTAILSTKAQLCLNADDPLVASLATSAHDPKQVMFFGINAKYQNQLTHDYTADSLHDPVTGSPLEYSQVYFGHMGHYRATKGSFKRPTPAVALTEFTDLGVAESRVKVKFGGQIQELALALPGLYNLYNALAALAVAEVRQIKPETALASLAKTAAAFGRVEKIVLKGREIYILLIKNPTGFNQIIQTFLLDQSEKNVLMIINDNFADGRDVSWLWDAAIEDLAPHKHQVITSGIRGYDMALRLKYADITPSKVELDPEVALQALIKATKPGETAYILPTYTAMLALRNLVRAEAGIERMGI
jgi:UDP-N-acetylmuramyl tripeptide synthase